jgi:hypothetical protein
VLDALTRAFAASLAGEGAAGPLNVQFRRDRSGGWKVHEINLRMTGSTLARFLFGFDELGLIVQGFLPGVGFPEVQPDRHAAVDQINRRYYAYPMPDAAVAALKVKRVWERE